MTALVSVPTHRDGRRFRLVPLLRVIRYRPLYVDLGDFELAAGMQLWIRNESKSRDAGTILLHDQLASAKYYSPRLQHVIDMLQLTKTQIDMLMDIFLRLDYDSDGTVLVSEWFYSMVRNQLLSSPRSASVPDAERCTLRPALAVEGDR